MRILREKEMEVSQQGVAVTKRSVAQDKDSIAITRDSTEKDREMQRQLMDAILSQRPLLQNMLLLGQQVLQFHKPGPSCILQSLDNTGDWN